MPPGIVAPPGGLSTPSPDAPRRSGANRRVPSDVKSGLYACLKWPIGDGTGDYWFKVPCTPPTTTLRRYLLARRETAVEYFDAGGRLAACQWRLSPREFGGLLR